MEDGQDMEEQHEAVGEDVEFNPDMWANLPGDHIEQIIEEALFATPSLRVGLPFCLAWKRWKDFLLSMEDRLPYLLYFHNLDECMILNPRTGLWESMPLLFPPADALRLQYMELISCDGGLLYFASAGRDELIVGNPLTRRCSPMLTRPNAARLIRNAQGKTRMSYPSEWRLAWYVTCRDVRNASPSDAQEIIVNNFVSSDKEPFQLLVAKRYQNGTTTSSMKLKDSRSVDWVTVPDIDRKFHFLCFPTFLWEARVQKSVILGFCAYPDRLESNVLFYDIEEQKCYWVWYLLSLPSSRTLCTSVSDGGEFEFLEFAEGGVKLTRAPFPPPTKVLRKNMPYKELRDRTTSLELDEMLNFVYVQQGDDEYHICLFREVSPRGEVNISVRRQNLVTDSQRISNWTEILPSASESRELPSSKNFHIFRPSFSSPC